MGYLEHFGFKIYRLRFSKVEKEFILYDINKNNYSQYSETRLYKYILLEFKDKNIDLYKFAREELNMDKGQIDLLKIIKFWVNEEVILLDDISFKPCNDKVFVKNDKTLFNTFKILDTLENSKYKLDSPMSFDEFKNKAPYHYKLFYNLHNKDDLAIKDTLLKLADKIRYPYEKSQDCLIFYPGEGAGKGIFYKFILQPIFKQYANKVLMKKLNSDFNGFIRESLILVLEEGKRDIELVETLKESITEGSMLINKKGVDQIEEDVYFLTFVFSNNMNPIDLGKRRGSYHLTHSLGKTIDESQTIGAELCENLPNETEILLKYLHNLEFKHQEAMRPFNTKAKSQVQELNKSAIELFFDYLLSFENLEKGLGNLYERRFKCSFYGIEKVEYTPRNKEKEIYISKDLFKNAYNNFCFLENLKNNIISHNKHIVQLWALFKIPEDAHQRILLKEGENQGRKLDHIRLKDINDYIKNNSKED